jgi:hypothetical protein
MVRDKSGFCRIQGKSELDSAAGVQDNDLGEIQARAVSSNQNLEPIVVATGDTGTGECDPRVNPLCGE